MTHRRAPCKIDAPAYVRDGLDEPHLELEMLSCWSIVRQLKFTDFASMHGRRGWILLVHGLVQARTSDLLGADWAACVSEVAAALTAVARTVDGDTPLNSEETSVTLDPDSTVLDALSAMDSDATKAVTKILTKRAKEMEDMVGKQLDEAKAQAQPKGKAGGKSGAKATKRARTSEPTSSSRTSQSPRKKTVSQSASGRSQRASRAGFVEGSSKASTSADNRA